MSKMTEVQTEDEVLKVNVRQEKFDILICEAKNTAILDSACTKTVAGITWKNIYIDSLPVEKKAQVHYKPGGSGFVFGGGAQFKSIEKLCIPATIAGKDMIIDLDIIEANVPLLLSKDDMKGM